MCMYNRSPYTHFLLTSCVTPPPLPSPQVWDIHTYALVKTLPSQNHWVRTLVISGKHLYSGSYQAVKVGVAYCIVGVAWNNIYVLYTVAPYISYIFLSFPYPFKSHFLFSDRKSVV